MSKQEYVVVIGASFMEYCFPEMVKEVQLDKIKYLHSSYLFTEKERNRAALRYLRRYGTA